MTRQTGSATATHAADPGSAGSSTTASPGRGGCRVEVPAGMVPVRVSAHLASGVVSGHRWGIGLDGLLAAQCWAELLEVTPADQVPWPSAVAVPPDLDLPLARCHTSTGEGEECWHWAASCAHTTASVAQVRYRYRPTPDRALEHLAATMPGTINPGTRYARRETPDLAQATTTLTWQAIGNPDQLRSLLTHVTAIGKGRQHGEGTVHAWTITPHPDANPWSFAHLHPDNTLGRPTPPACLPTHLTDAHPMMRAGLRPPVMHPARQHQLCTPTT